MREHVDASVGSPPNSYCVRDPALMFINIQSWKLGIDSVHDVATFSR